MTESDPVVVGVDDSEEAALAVRWAADLAARHGNPLIVLHAWIWPLFNVPLGPAPGAPADGGLRNLAERTVREAIGAARALHPTLEVTGRLVTAATAIALRNQSETASAVVIGSNGYGKIGTFLLGSVGVDLAGHTRCPLVVVRGTETSDGPVVLGVDDSPRSHEAIEYAFREAAALGVVLRAVHSWSTPPLMSDWTGAITELLATEESLAGEALERLIAPWHTRYPDVRIEYLTPQGSAAHHLVEASHGAQVVVVGARGRGGFRGLVLGSTSHALMHRAECPVVVAPQYGALDDAGADEPIQEEPIQA